MRDLHVTCAGWPQDRLRVEQINTERACIFVERAGKYASPHAQMIALSPAKAERLGQWLLDFARQTNLPAEPEVI